MDSEQLMNHTVMHSSALADHGVVGPVGFSVDAQRSADGRGQDTCITSIITVLQPSFVNGWRTIAMLFLLFGLAHVLDYCYQ